MDNEINKVEKRIKSLEGMAMMTLVIFILIAVGLLLVTLRTTALMPHGTASLISLLPLLSSFIIFIAGFLAYYFLLVFCDMAKNILYIKLGDGKKYQN